MNNLLTSISAAAALATTGCDVEKPPSAEAPRSVSIAIDSGGEASAGSGKTSGKVEITLPGGIGAKIDLPDGLEKGEQMDIAGVGLYPGGKLSTVKVDARTAGATKTAKVEFGFSAPGDAAAVADWYQQQFEANGTKVTRQGETLSGTAEDGDRFTLAMLPAGKGASRGQVTIINTN